MIGKRPKDKGTLFKCAAGRLKQHSIFRDGPWTRTMLIQVLKVGSGLVGTLQPFKLLDIFNGFRTLNVLKNQPELELRPVFLAPDVYIHIYII